MTDEVVESQQAGMEAPPGAEAQDDNGEGGGRSRRRRRGRGGDRDRGERSERPDRDQPVAEGETPQLFDAAREYAGETDAPAAPVSEAREERPAREAREPRPPREPRAPREPREPREQGESREQQPRESREQQPRESRESQPRESRESQPHEQRAQGDSRPAMESAAPAPTVPVVTPVPSAAYHPVIQHADAEEEAHRPVRRRKTAAETAAAEPSLQLVETQAPSVMAPAEDELPRRTKPRRRRSAATESEPLKLVETQPGAERPESPNP